MEFKALLEKLIAGQALDATEMETTMDALMEGQLTPVQVGAFLTALRIKGETTTEIAAAARSLRRHATRIDAGPPPVVDTCGTGGDRAGTFNISTTAAFIAAGAGVKIAKHGNRSVSSQCGSADVLAALGVNLEAPPARVGAAVREVGIGFLFAPALHGSMKHAGGPRRELGVRTLFNVLGPLSNPAGADVQLLGVFAPELTEPLATVLLELGTRRAMVVHGLDRLDEITGTTNTRVSELRNGLISTYELDPRPYLGGYCSAEALRGGDAATNAAIVRAILDGEESPRARVAQLNAAAAITLAGEADDLTAGMKLARESAKSGAARDRLARLVAFSRG